MDDVKKQVAERLKQATNILVTVRTDPSIDLLSACLGLSLVLDKIGKHATAVFSGEVPSVMEFLKPEETIEQTPNSLRDFIISLDKSKADKLRYKVEDKVVRIFITPFKAGLTQDDLEFSQGDFNIDLLVALGVHEQAELDAAVTAHGRILHDAAIISINTTPNGNLGTLNWQETNVSSVSEMVADLAKTLDPNVFDEQIATAILTGIVAETARFSNDKTSPRTMQVAGDLMAAGANQQLVATELQSAITVGAPGTVKAETKSADDNGTLEIKHEAAPTEALAEPEAPKKPTKQVELPPEEPTPQLQVTPEATPVPTPKAVELPQPEPQEEMTPLQPNPRTILPMPDPSAAGNSPVSDVSDTPFTDGAVGGATTGAGKGYLVDKLADLPQATVGTDQSIPPMPSLASTPFSMPTPTPPADDHKGETLQEIESSVGSPHEATADAPRQAEAAALRLDDARQQVLDALKQGPQPLEPLAALGASAPTQVPHDDNALAMPAAPVDEGPTQPVAIEVDAEGNMTPAEPEAQPVDTTMSLPPIPSFSQQPSQPAAQTTGSTSTAPPPVPPPMMPPSFGQ